MTKKAQNGQTPVDLSDLLQSHVSYVLLLVIPRSRLVHRGGQVIRLG